MVCRSAWHLEIDANTLRNLYILPAMQITLNGSRTVATDLTHAS